MAFGKCLVDGTAYEITAGKTLVGGTTYGITSGTAKRGGTDYNVEIVSMEHTIGVANGSNLNLQGSWKGYVEYNGTIYTSGSITAQRGETIKIYRKKANLSSMTSVNCSLRYQASATSGWTTVTIAPYTSSILGSTSYTLQGVATNIQFSTTTSGGAGGGEIM